MSRASASGTSHWIWRGQEKRGLALGLTLIGALFLAVQPGLSHAEERRDAELTQWTPSFGVFLGSITQKARGASLPSKIAGPPLSTFDADGRGCLIKDNRNGTQSRNGGLCPSLFSEPNLRPRTRSSDLSVAPLAGATFELMSPRLLDIPTSPRAYAHFDIQAAFGFERNLAGEGRPDDFSAPKSATLQTNVVGFAVLGQGSRTISQVQPLLISAGAGFAFTTHLFNRTIRIKPSIEYMRQEQRLIGQLRRAVKLEDPATPNTLKPNEFRLISMRQTDTIEQHGIGGGLEIEADSGRIGPFVLSVFGWGRGYQILNNLDATLRESESFTDDETGAPLRESVRWDFEFESLLWRAGAGVRFRYRPQ